jgi:homoserine O-acetyltransferase
MLPKAENGSDEFTESAWVATNFAFHTGELLQELYVNYTSIGNPSEGVVLILHPTDGSAVRDVVKSRIGRDLIGPGKVIDTSKYQVVIPDQLGHGKSAKPSDGLGLAFPRYNYVDMINAQYRLLVEHLQIDRLRLILGFCMGGMQGWLWGALYPQFMDAILNLCSSPGPIIGRTRGIRRLIVDAIRTDPAWEHGRYSTQPHGLLIIRELLMIMISSPSRLQTAWPTGEDVDIVFDRLLRLPCHSDANDLLYSFEAGNDYNALAGLESIEARVLAVNFADDELNPPELQGLTQEINRVKRGQYILIPEGPETKGHYSYLVTHLWEPYLRELLRSSNEEDYGGDAGERASLSKPSNRPIRRG